MTGGLLTDEEREHLLSGRNPIYPALEKERPLLRVLLIVLFLGAIALAGYFSKGDPLTQYLPL